MVLIAIFYVGITVSWSCKFIGVLGIERGVVILSHVLRQHVLPELIQPLQKRVVALHRSGDVSLSDEGRTQTGDAIAPVAHGIVDRGRRGGVRGQRQVRTSQLNSTPINSSDDVVTLFRDLFFKKRPWWDIWVCRSDSNAMALSTGVWRSIVVASVVLRGDASLSLTPLLLATGGGGTSSLSIQAVANVVH